MFAELLETRAYAEVAVTPCVPVLANLRNGLTRLLYGPPSRRGSAFQHGVFEFLGLFESPTSRRCLLPPCTPRMWDVLSQYQHTSLVFGYYVTIRQRQGLMVSDL